MARKVKETAPEPLIPTKPRIDLQFRPKTPKQREAVELWKQSRILFLLGASGSGKTHLALALALQTILNTKRDDGPKPKLILSRPALGCDEDLGYLPGELNDKLTPWMAAFKDVFGEMSTDRWVDLEKLVDVELVSVGMLRGRSVVNSVLILDESQNATAAQIKCALTRIGRGGRIVFTGDTDQSDLFHSSASVPVLNAALRLQDLDAVSMVQFTSEDVVRDPLVSAILDRL